MTSNDEDIGKSTKIENEKDFLRKIKSKIIFFYFYIENQLIFTSFLFFHFVVLFLR